MQNQLIEGDPLDPSDADIIVQTDFLEIGKPVPEGWRVMSGGQLGSAIMRIVYRYELEAAA